MYSLDALDPSLTKQTFDRPGRRTCALSHYGFDAVDNTINFNAADRSVEFILKNVQRADVRSLRLRGASRTGVAARRQPLKTDNDYCPAGREVISDLRDAANSGNGDVRTGTRPRGNSPASSSQDVQLFSNRSPCPAPEAGGLLQRRNAARRPASHNRCCCCR